MNRKSLQNKNQDDLKITQEDLRQIHGSDWVKFQEKILKYCYCGHCQSNYKSEIVDYKIYLNDINDVILQGKCKSCGRPIGRYVETGEVPKYQLAIEEVRRKYNLN